MKSYYIPQLFFFMSDCPIALACLYVIPSKDNMSRLKINSIGWKRQQIHRRDLIGYRKYYAFCPKRKWFRIG